jgi:hypothetical protein
VAKIPPGELQEAPLLIKSWDETENVSNSNAECGTRSAEYRSRVACGFGVKPSQTSQAAQSDLVKANPTASRPANWAGVRISNRLLDSMRVHASRCDQMRDFIFMETATYRRDSRTTKPSQTASGRVKPIPSSREFDQIGPSLAKLDHIWFLVERPWTLLYRVIDWGAAVLYCSLKLPGDTAGSEPYPADVQHIEHE